MDATATGSTGWHTATQLLYIVAVVLMFLLIYYVLFKQNNLYSSFNWQKIKGGAATPKTANIINQNVLMFLPATKYVTIQYDDKGVITSKIENVVSFTAYCWLNELENVAITVILNYFRAQNPGESLRSSLYPLLPVIITKLDYLKDQKEATIDCIKWIITTLAEDKNSQDYRTVCLYIAANEYNVNVKLEDDFQQACTNINDVKTLMHGKISNNEKVLAFYAEGNLATESRDDVKILNSVIPYLYCISLFRGKYNLALFDSIVPAHKLLKNTLENSFQLKAGIFDPRYTSTLDVFDHIQLALLIQCIQPVYSQTVVEELMYMQSRYKPQNWIDLMLLYTTYFPLIPATQQMYEPRPFVWNSGTWTATINSPKYRITVGESNAANPLRAYAPTLDMYNGAVLEKQKLYQAYQPTITKWDEVNHYNVAVQHDKAIVGLQQSGTTIDQLKGMSQYYLYEDESFSFLNLFSNLSFNDSQEFQVFSLVSISLPQIQNAYLNKSQDNVYKVAANSPVGIRCRSYNDNVHYNIQCGQELTVTITSLPDEAVWTVTCTVKKMSTLSVKKQTAEVQYRYCNATISTLCDYVPQQLPMLYVAPFQKEHYVVRYLDYTGLNRYNLYSMALSNSLFLNLQTSPIISTTERGRLLGIDKLSKNFTGDIVYNQDAFSLTSIEGKQISYDTKTRIATAAKVYFVVVPA